MSIAMPPQQTYSFTVGQLRSNHTLNEAVDLIRQGHIVLVDYDDITSEAQRAYLDRVGMKDMYEWARKMALSPKSEQQMLVDFVLENDILAGKMHAAIIDQKGFILGGERL